MPTADKGYGAFRSSCVTADGLIQTANALQTVDGRINGGRRWTCTEQRADLQDICYALAGR